MHFASIRRLFQPALRWHGFADMRVSIALALYAESLLIYCSLARWRGVRLGSLNSYGNTVVAFLLVAGVTMLCIGGDPTHALAFALSYSCVAALTDLSTGLIFDGVSWAAACGVFCASLLSGTLVAAVFGMLTGAGPLVLLILITRGRGVGLGDVKVAAIVGAALGAPSALLMLGVAYVAGALWGIVLIARRRATRKERIAFAPFLAFGAEFGALWTVHHA
jgi:prepilin signal peptidase PulO-like enzyme (type II secretory pathway)